MKNKVKQTGETTAPQTLPMPQTIQQPQEGQEINSKTQKRKNLGKMLCVGLATVCLALLPLSVFAVADAARFQAVESAQQPYTSVSPTSDDFYLLRTLRSRSQARYGNMSSRPDVPSLYLAAKTARDSMARSPEVYDYALEILQSMADCGALSQNWANAVTKQIEENPYDFYTSSDTLGLVTISYFTDENGGFFTNPATLYSVTVDGKTGAVVSLFLTHPQNHSMPAQNVALNAFINQAGLSSLADWSQPVGTSYEKSGLYSMRGQALVTCATGEYSTYYSNGTKPVRFYYSLLLSTLDETLLGAMKQ